MLVVKSDHKQMTNEIVRRRIITEKYNWSINQTRMKGEDRLRSDGTEIWLFDTNMSNTVKNVWVCWLCRAGKYERRQWNFVSIFHLKRASGTEWLDQFDSNQVFKLYHSVPFHYLNGVKHFIIGHKAMHDVQNDQFLIATLAEISASFSFKHYQLIGKNHCCCGYPPQTPLPPSPWSSSRIDYSSSTVCVWRFRLESIHRFLFYFKWFNQLQSSLN